MQTVLILVLRLIFVAAGLIFAASMAVAFVVMAGLWALRAAWAKITGQALKPFVMGADLREGFERMYRRSTQGSRTPRADAVRSGRPAGDATDVEYREPGA